MSILEHDVPCLTAPESNGHATDASLDEAAASRQAERRGVVLTAHRDRCVALFDTDGRYTGPGECEWRWPLWHAASLLDGEAAHVALADAMLRRGIDDGDGHFWTCAVAVLLTRFGDRMAPDVSDHLRARLTTELPGERGSEFRGYNDNFPSMAALALLVGSTATGQAALVDDGLAILDGARRLLTRRGFLSEYVSPSYSAVTLCCLAHIVELAPSAEARDLARDVEHRVWAEIASHFHAPTSSLAGPYSRAYLVDLCGHYGSMHPVLYAALGEGVFVNPLTALRDADPAQTWHDGGAEAAWARTAWYATPTYHVPPDLEALATRKPYPFTVDASAEQGAFPRNWHAAERHPVTPTLEYQASETSLHAHLTADYAIGTSSRPSMNGYQHAAFHVTYRTRRPAHPGLRDVATLFSRYVVNGKRPRRGDHNMEEEGRTLGVAHESSAMMLYWPKPAWNAAPPVEDASTEPVRSLALSLVVASFFSRPDEVWLGETRVEAWRGSSAEPVPVFLRHGPLFVALYPLIGSDLGRGAAIRLAEEDGFGFIDLVNYDGPPRTFDLIELATCRNGFVSELASSSDWPSFDAFRAFHARPRITDRFTAFTGTREVTYDREGLSLAMEISPLSEGVKYRAVNGVVPQAPKLCFRPAVDVDLPWS